MYFHLQFFLYFKDVHEPQLLNNDIKEHWVERGWENDEILATWVYQKEISKMYADDDFEFQRNSWFYPFKFINHHWFIDESLSKHWCLILNGLLNRVFSTQLESIKFHQHAKQTTRRVHMSSCIGNSSQFDTILTPTQTQ